MSLFPRREILTTQVKSTKSLFHPGNTHGQSPIMYEAFGLDIFPPDIYHYRKPAASPETVMSTCGPSVHRVDRPGMASPKTSSPYAIRNGIYDLTRWLSSSIRGENHDRTSRSGLERGLACASSPVSTFPSHLTKVVISSNGTT